MSALPEQRDWTVQAYLEYERDADTRHEFMDGDVYAMAGASENHNYIASAVNFALFGQLLDRPCGISQNDMRVQASASAFFYPDIVVVCDEPLYSDERPATLLNPTVIFEILSPTTEDYDRGRKFTHYQEIASLQDYVLVAQDRMRAEHYTRQAADRWLLTVYSQKDDRLVLPSIGCTLTVSDLYRKVNLGDAE